MLCGEPSEATLQAGGLTLSGWVGRRRDHGGLIFIDLRDHSGFVQLVVDPERAPEAHARAQTLRLESVVRARGSLIRRDRESINPNIPTGTVELSVECARAALVERGAAVPARRRERRRGTPHPPPLSRSAPPENAGIAGHSYASGALDPALPGRARLPRPGDPDDDARDARGRARLRHPVPARARGVLCAAAEPAALQAAADVRRLRPLLPDRALLAGRGAARRPRARVHPARSRDELRRAGGRAHADRAADGRGLARRRPRDRAAVPARALRRGARALRLRQARPALRPRDRRRQRGRGGLGVRRLLARGGRRRCRALPERARSRRGALAQGLRRARRVRQGVGREGTRVPHLRGRRQRALADPEVPLRGGGGGDPRGIRRAARLGRVHRRGRPARGRARAGRPAAAPRAPLRADPGRRVEVPLRRRLPALQAERGGRRLDGRAPPVHRAQARARGSCSRAIPGRCSPRPTTWC